MTLGPLVTRPDVVVVILARGFTVVVFLVVVVVVLVVSEGLRGRALPVAPRVRAMIESGVGREGGGLDGFGRELGGIVGADRGEIRMGLLVDGTFCG